MNAPLSLTQLAAAWRAAKADEQAANARRLEIEEQIVAAIPGAVEGTETAEVDGWKVKVARKLTRAVDSDKLSAMWMTLPATAQKVFAWKATVKARELHGLQEFAADEYARIAAFIEVKPAKPTVTVEAVAP